MTTTTNTGAASLSDEQIEALKAAALAATPQNIDSAQRIERYEDGSFISCPACGGEGNVELNSDFCNYDGEALGVQFYGIGNAHKLAEDYFRAAKPATVLALIERLQRAEATTIPQADAAPIPVEMVGVAHELQRGNGAWRPCTGCYDTEDGHPTQCYQHSAHLGCALGNGCSECGGLGAVWDDYSRYDALTDERTDAAIAAGGAQEPVATVGWTGHGEADNAIILLGRLDVSADDDARVDQIERAIRYLAKQAMGIVADGDGHILNATVKYREVETFMAPIAETSANVAQGAEAVAWREEAQRLFDRCKLWPERTSDGFMALIELRNHVEKLLKNAALAAAQSASASEGK